MSGDAFLDHLTHEIDDLRWPALPARTRTRAADCVVDAIACAFGGSELPVAGRARAAVRRWGAPGTATVWGGGPPVGVADAAFVNAVAAHALVHEDMHPESRSHPGTMVVPAALAVGEHLASRTSDVLAAVVAGYEVMAQVARVVATPDFVARGFRPSSVFGPFGAAAAAGRLLGLDRRETVNALAIAASAASGVCEWAHGGSSDAFVQNGTAARAGVVAATLAAEGVDGPATAIEGSFGFLRAFSGPVEAVPPPLVDRTDLAIDAVYFKAHASCAFTQEAITAALELHRSGTAASAVESATVHTYAMGKHYPGCDNATSLAGVLERQMSNQFAVAAALLDGELAVSRYAGGLAPEVADLARRITVAVDAEADRLYPAIRRVRLTARLHDGTVREACVNGGGYLSGDQVVDKLGHYGGGLIDPADRTRLVQGLRAPEPHDRIAPLVALLGRAHAEIGG